MNFKKAAYILSKIKNNKNFTNDLYYLMNKKMFYKKKIKILYNILVPNQDTEEIINIYNKIKNTKKKIFEICFGSNNIKISINNFYKFNNIDIFFLCSLLIKKTKKNFYSFITDLNKFKNIKKYNNFISNPPYLKRKELINLNYEHKKLKNNLATDENGLKKIKTIIKNLNSNKLINSNIIIEHSYNQYKKINKIIKKIGFVKTYLKKNIITFEN